MMTVRARIEAGFGVWGAWVVRRRWLVISVVSLFTVGLGSFLPQVRVDNSSESFLKSDDPSRRIYDQFQERFGREDTVSVILRPAEIFDIPFLEGLRSLHEDIEASVPYVEEVTSLVNARNTRGDADELIVEELMESWPATAEELAKIRERALANPLYRNILLSEDAALTLISIRPFTYSTLTPEQDLLEGFDEGGEGPSGEAPAYLSEAESSELVAAVAAVLARHPMPGVEMHLIGGPVMDLRLSQIMMQDMGRSFPLAMGIIVILLFVLFRRVSAIVLPVVVVVASIVATLGWMVMLGIPFSITLNILPAFLLTVGVCDSIHILVIVFRRLDEGASREEAIAFALGHSGLAVTMTSLTTAAGLFSFIVAELGPVAHIGAVAPVGVMLAMLYSLSLLPALLAVIPLRARDGRNDAVAAGTNRAVRFAVDPFMEAVTRVSTEHPVAVVATTLAILLVALTGVMRVGFSHDGMRWFPEDDPMRMAAELVDDEFGGASSLEVVVDTGAENGLHDPATLERIETLMRESRQLAVGNRPVSKAISIVDVAKETHQALNENDPAYYALPDDRRLLAQELLLFENSGSDDLEDLTDSQFQLARISLRTPWVDGMLYPAFVADAEALVRRTLGDGVEYQITGGAAIFTTIFRAVTLSMARSYVLAFTVITPLLVLLVGSFKRGVVAMIPNLVPLYLCLALMGWLDIPLDISTLLIGGILLGVAVDDTIHFMHKFNRYYEDLGDATAAVRETLRTTGAALLFTSLVLCLGFSVFMTSYLSNMSWFGLLTAVATIVAFLADVVLAPALMVLVTGREKAVGRTA